MAVRYKVQVINVNSVLRIRSGPSTSSSVTGSRKNGEIFIIDQVENGSDGSTWYKQEGSNNWSCAKTSSGQDYIGIMEDLLKSTETETKKEPDPTPKEAPKAEKTVSFTQPQNIKTVEDDLNGGLSGLPKQNDITKITGNYDTFKLYTGTNYIAGKDGKIYDYRIKTSSFDKNLEIIKKNMNIPTAYTQNEINSLYHSNFNRYRIEYPDLYLRNTIPVIFFTRPDINLFDDDTGKIVSSIKSDAKVYNALLRNETAGRLLTRAGTDSVNHDFNPLLSNLAQNLEIADDSVDTVETGETFTGQKLQYSKHNIKSITAGDLSIKFRETFDLAITDTFQIWVDYQSNVYMGIYEPKRKYIWAKIIDYACDIYYFLLDQDGETIKFWTKYFGVFPVNVPKSTFGFDMGSQVKFPELSISFKYIYKEDLNPLSLVEFNHNAGDDTLGYKYVPNYESALGHSGTTWVGTPFVSSYEYSNGSMAKANGYKLRYRKMN